MKKVQVLIFYLILSVVVKAEVVVFALQEGDAFASGQMVQVKEGIVSITFGENGGADFFEAIASHAVDGYYAYTRGNGVNGNSTGGTFYTIKTEVPGTVEVAVMVNANKPFYIEENGSAMEAYNGIEVEEKYIGTYTFDAKASSSYKIYCAGSKLGFYGFKFSYNSGSTTSTCSTPTFHQDGNQLSIHSSTPDAVIYYTLDGSMPTPNSTKYDGPISLTQSCTVRAIVVAEGYEASEVAIYNFIYIDPAANVLKWNFSDFEVGEYYDVVTINGLTINPNRGSITIDENNKTVDDVTYTKRLKFGGGGDATSRNISFNAAEAGTLKVILTSASSAEDREIGVSLNGTEIGTIPARGGVVETATISIPAAGTVAIYSKQSGCNLYLVEFTAGGVNSTNWYVQEGMEGLADGVIRGGTTLVDNSLLTAKTVYDSNVANDAVSFFNKDFESGMNLRTYDDPSVDNLVGNQYDGSTPLVITPKTNVKLTTYYRRQRGTNGIERYDLNDNKDLLVADQTDIETILDGTLTVGDILDEGDDLRYARKSYVLLAGHTYTMFRRGSTIRFYGFDFEETNAVCAAPTITSSGNRLVMTTSTPGATIYYTLDGSLPSTRSSQYTGPVTPTQNCQVRAIAVKKEMGNSSVTSFVVEWFQVDPVSISFVNMKVQLSTATPNARIHYTTDGNTPTTDSQIYTEPFSVSQSCTVRSIAVKDYFYPSVETSLFIDLDNVRCEMPTFQLVGRELTITSSTDGASVYYTLDGSDPTTDSYQYTSPVTLTRNGIVKAIAVKNGYLNSMIGSYDMTYFQVDMPTFMADGNILTITCGTAGASIYYIIDEGEIEIVEQNKYVSPITLSGERIVRAIGVLDGYRNSAEATYNYQSFSCGDVTFQYDGHYVFLSSETEGADIYFTTDGSNPTSASQKYTGNAIPVNDLYTINAIATKTNMNNSKVTSMDIAYFFDGKTAVVKEPGLLGKAFEWIEGSPVPNELEIKGRLNTSDLNQIWSSVEHLKLGNATIEGNSLPNKAFANRNLVSVELPAGLTSVGRNLFENCNRLASVIWHSDIDLTTEAMAGINNPNLIYYVNSVTLAPQADNVVSLATNQATNIVLQDVAEGDGNFYCLRPFLARKISYTRNFKLHSGKGASAGWETITLPFNVATVTHERNGLLSPFGSNVSNTKPFWLYSLQESGFNPAMEIVANTPYIICMPNNEDYANEYNQYGNVTFSATDVEIPVTSVVASIRKTADGTISLIPTYSKITEANNLYAINRELYKGIFEPGSVFAPSSDIRPFEAYSTVEMKSSNIPHPSYIPIFNNGTPTGIFLLEKSRGDMSDVWYSIDGQKLQGKPRAKGIYIVNGRKVVIK